MKPLWVEAVLCAGCTWPDGRALVPFEPFEVARPFRVGGKGADLEWSHHEFQLSPHQKGLLFTRPGNRFVLAPLESCWPSLFPPSPLVFRVMRTPWDTAGWPRSISRPPAPWTSGTRAVLADQLHELGFLAAHRFAAREPSEDDAWLPALRFFHGSVAWQRGCVAALTADTSFTFVWGFALAAQLLCAPMRELALRHQPRQGGGRPTPTSPVDPLPLIRGMIAAGGLPCLERLQLEFDLHPGTLTQEVRRLPGFESAFPSLRRLELGISARPFGVLG